MIHMYIHLSLLLFSLTVLTILAPTLAHSSNHMELTEINHWRSDENNVVNSDYRVATGLHLHHGDAIYLVRVVASISDSASTFKKPLIDYQSFDVTPTDERNEATTESSYNYGAKMASKEWAGCGVSSNGNCWSGSAICWGEPGSGYVAADNKTSCMNGFVTSWNELCRVQSKIAKIEQIQCPTSVGQEMPHF